MCLDFPSGRRPICIMVDNAAPNSNERVILKINICILLSYNNNINSGDRKDIIAEKKMKHTIRNNTPVSALKNNFTKNILSFIAM